MYSHYSRSLAGEINEIEKRLRRTLCKVLEIKNIESPTRFSRNTEIASLPGFDNDSYRDIISHDGLLHPFYSLESGVDSFGTRIRDWVNLLAWRTGIIAPCNIQPGLGLYFKKFSFKLGSKVSSEDRYVWHVKKSKNHRIDEKPEYGNNFMKLDIDNLSASSAYSLFLSKISR